MTRCVLTGRRLAGPASLLAVMLTWALAGAAQAGPAPSVPVTDTYHGTPLADPFRNLEDLKHPDTRAWMLDQGAQAAATLARISVRDGLQQRITELARSTGDVVRGIVRRPGGRLFYLKRVAGEAQFKLIVRDGLNGAERVLVDPQALAQAQGGVPHAVNYYQPSWDGRTLAYGVSAGGSEEAALHLLDVASGRQLMAPLSRVPEGAMHWSPDNRFFGFNRLRALPPGAPEAETYLDSEALVLDRRHPQQPPRAVFGPQLRPDLRLERLDVGTLLMAPGSRWVLARTTDTTVPEGKLFVAPVAALARPGPVPWRLISTAADKVTDAQLRGDTLFLRSYAAAPRGQVLALDLAARGGPRLAQARVVVPEPARGVLESFVLGRQAVYGVLQLGFGVRVLRHDPARPGAGDDLSPDAGGTHWPVVQPGARDELWTISGGWTAPSRVLARGADGRVTDTGLRRNPLPAAVPELQVTEVEVPSHDGVRVPLAVLHKKGLALDGRNATLLDGYGAYGLTTQAWYDARRFAWLERGGVLAWVNPRGSGAFGDDWHRAGFKTTKPNTWLDGIAAARWLVAQGYASPATLGIEGGSAGGIFVGRAVTAAPELFAAAIADVPVMDAVRAEISANGATNISEFGSFKDPVEFKALLAMSTYHQVRDGTAYPALLFVHGLNDPRVDPWHSAKAVARFQQAQQTAPGGGKPVLLRLDAQAGHGIGNTAGQVAQQMADGWAFLLWQFGQATLKP